MKRLLALCLLTLLMAACEGDMLISRRFPCRFTLYYMYHQTSPLFTVVESPGQFVYINSYVAKNGERHVRTYGNVKGKATLLEDFALESQKENYASFVLGADTENGVGIFIGCTNFNGPVAYDRTCPNCLDKKALSFTSNTDVVECKSCRRTYSLNNFGGILSGEKGERMMQYDARVTETMQGRMLQVGN